MSPSFLHFFVVDDIHFHLRGVFAWDFYNCWQWFFVAIDSGSDFVGDLIIMFEHVYTVMRNGRGTQMSKDVYDKVTTIRFGLS